MATLLTGDLIRAARGLLGLSQSALAKKAGMTQKALGEFELGKKSITAKANEKLRRVFEDEQIQFIAANVADSHLVGSGVRWKTDHPYSDIKVI
jgi:transcriptional regulator with XRE-family HTH domain